MPTSTNDQLFEQIRRTASKNLQTLKITSHPNPGFPNGVDVFVDGRWTAWFAKLSTPVTD